MDGKEMIEVYGINPVRVEPRKVPQWEHYYSSVIRTQKRFEKIARDLPKR